MGDERKHQTRTRPRPRPPPPPPPPLACWHFRVSRPVSVCVCAVQLLPGGTIGVRVADRDVPLAPVGPARQGKTLQVQHHQQVLQPLSCKKEGGGAKRAGGEDECRKTEGDRKWGLSLMSISVVHTCFAQTLVPEVSYLSALTILGRVAALVCAGGEGSI